MKTLSAEEILKVIKHDLLHQKRLTEPCIKMIEDYQFTSQIEDKEAEEKVERNLHLEINSLQNVVSKLYKLGKETSAKLDAVSQLEYINSAMSIVKTAKTELSQPLKAEESDAVEFAEWIRLNCHQVYSDGKWNKSNVDFSHITTKELYQQFLKQK